MPPGFTDEGLRAAITIRRDHPETGVLVFSQYIETRYTADLLGAASGGGAAGVGYLLKDRVADVGEFVDALSRVAAGGTALDPEVVTQLFGASRADGLGSLTARERDVLTLMAEGRTNGAIAGAIGHRPPAGARRPALPGVLTSQRPEPPAVIRPARSMRSRRPGPA
jgi:DNA-binding NarL/FixJ family response regulator